MRPNQATLRFAINYAALKAETKFTAIPSDNDLHPTMMNEAK